MNKIILNKTKKVLSLLYISWIVIWQTFATDVSGPISTNTTWTLANNPYIVVGNVLVNNGVTLTIEPGVLVKFNAGLSLQISGKFLAKGTSSKKITFTSNTIQEAGAWGYIYFSDASTDAVYDIYGVYVSGSILEHCIIKYAGGATVSNNGALRLDAAHPFINYCTISYNNALGVSAYNLTGTIKISNSIVSNNTSLADGGGIFTSGGTVSISNNTISNNSGGSGFSSNSGTITISYNTISNNSGGIGITSGDIIVTISNNIISNNSVSNGGGIASWESGSVNISNNIISNNSATEGGAIYSYNYWSSGTFTITNNIIINNTAYKGGGIYNYRLYGDLSKNIIADNNSTNTGGGICYVESSSTINNNIIIRNTATDYAGIVSPSGLDIKFNTIAYNGNTDFNNLLNRTISITGNPIINNNNIFGNVAFYELSNDNAQGTPNLAATKNWWGTANSAQVQTKIYDWIDDGSKGLVNFSPYLSTPDTTAPLMPPANFTKMGIGGGQVKITWNKNPEPDLAGYRAYWGGFTGYSFTNSFDVGTDTSYILSGVSVTDIFGVTAYDNTYSPTSEDTSTITNDNMTNGNESWFAYSQSSGSPIDTIIITSTNVNCFGVSTGTATVTVTGGTSPFTYQWNDVNSQSTATATGLSAGTYMVTVNDNTGWIASDTVTITEPASALSLTKTSTNNSCFSGNNGAINITVSGGTSGYTYLWSNSATTQDVNSLIAGTYTVTVTDSKSCTLTNSTIVTQPASALSISKASTNNSCFGNTNGAIDITVSGGTSPYIYMWSNNTTTQDVGSLIAGTYTVTVTDSKSCTLTNSIAITQPTAISIGFNSGSTSCSASTGYATALVTGGTPPYTYQWNNGSTDNTIDSLVSGIYLVTVTDSKGCSTFSYTTIDENNGPNISSVINDVTCYNGNNGSINITITSGTPPYSYNWSNGASTQNISLLTAGTYDVIISDNNGCQQVQSFVIKQPDNILISVTVTNAVCGGSNGTALAAISGGISPYSLLWSTGATTNNIQNLSAGLYSLSVTDAKGCVKVKTAGISISSSGGPQITLDSVIHVGSIGNNGAIYITASGGTLPYTSFSWSNGSTTEDITNLYAGVYSVTVTDNAGCKGVFSDSVHAFAPSNQPICLVFVDSTTGKNKIIWERIQQTGIANYNIYRESNTAGLYNKMASVPGNISEYIDYQSYPMVRAYRYKISAVDGSGKESSLSTHHKTMHLTMNEGIIQTFNLIWDYYEGFSFSTYLIYRYTNQTGWKLIDSLPSNLNSYTDKPQSMGKLFYRIGVLKNDSCNSYNHSYSNTDENSIPVYFDSYKNSFDVKIYPNPANGTVIIEGLQSVGKIEIINLLGKVIKNMDITEERATIDISKLTSGVYTLKIKTTNSIVAKKLIKQ